jgi:hypothetical protein
MAFVTAARIPARLAAAMMMIHSFAVDSVTDHFRKLGHLQATPSIPCGTQEAIQNRVFASRNENPERCRPETSSPPVNPDHLALRVTRTPNVSIPSFFSRQGAKVKCWKCEASVLTLRLGAFA